MLEDVCRAPRRRLSPKRLDIRRAGQVLSVLRRGQGAPRAPRLREGARGPLKEPGGRNPGAGGGEALASKSASWGASRARVGPLEGSVRYPGCQDVSDGGSHCFCCNLNASFLKPSQAGPLYASGPAWSIYVHVYFLELFRGGFWSPVSWVIQTLRCHLLQEPPSVTSFRHRLGWHRLRAPAERWFA